MNRFVWLVLLLPLSLPAVATDYVYIKRSELTAFALGQQAGEAAGQVMNVRQFSAHRQTGYAQLDALRAELAACGSCAKRGQLEVEIKELQTSMLREDRVLCGTFLALGDADPSISAVMKLTGYQQVCDRFNQEATIVEAEWKNKRNKEEFLQRVQTGDVTAYGYMGQRTMTTNRHLPFAEQMNLACPYWFEGARKGDGFSIESVAQLCLMNAPDEAERRDAFDWLRACSRRDHRCARALAGYYETTRHPAPAWPIAADDREALRLYETALQLGSQAPRNEQNARALAADTAAIERVRQRLAGGAAALPAPPVDGVKSGVAGTVPPVAAPPVTQPVRPPVVNEPRSPVARVDPNARRCEILRRAYERNAEAAVRDPVKYASRAATAQAQYQRACG